VFKAKSLKARQHLRKNSDKFQKYIDQEIKKFESLEGEI